MAADYGRPKELRKQFLYSGIGRRILTKRFHHVIIDFLGVHSFYMKVFDNSSDIFLVLFSGYPHPLRIEIVSSAYINTADKSDLMDKVIRPCIIVVCN